MTHQGAAWNPMVAGLRGIQFPTILQRKTLWPPFVRTETWDAARIAALFRQIAEWQQRNGVPVIINEFGAIANGALQDRVCWVYAVRHAAETNSIGWAYWDYFYPEVFGLAANPGGWPPTLNPELAAALGLKNVPSTPVEDCR